MNKLYWKLLKRYVKQRKFPFGRLNIIAKTTALLGIHSWQAYPMRKSKKVFSVAKQNVLRNFWALRLIIHAMMCYMWRFFLWWNDLNHTKMAKPFQILDPGFQNSGRIFGIFSKLGEVKDKMLSQVDVKYQRNTLQQKRLMHLPYFGQDLDLNKKVVLILAHVCQ